jgi:hypothetical protein
MHAPRTLPQVIRAVGQARYGCPCLTGGRFPSSQTCGTIFKCAHENHVIAERLQFPSDDRSDIRGYAVPSARQYPFDPKDEVAGDIGAAFAVGANVGSAISVISARAAISAFMIRLHSWTIVLDLIGAGLVRRWTPPVLRRFERATRISRRTTAQNSNVFRLQAKPRPQLAVIEADEPHPHALLAWIVPGADEPANEARARGGEQFGRAHREFSLPSFEPCLR